MRQYEGQRTWCVDRRGVVRAGLRHVAWVGGVTGRGGHGGHGHRHPRHDRLPGVAAARGPELGGRGPGQRGVAALRLPALAERGLVLLSQRGK